MVGSAAVSASASESLPPCRTRSTVLAQSVASPVVTIMSLRMRKVVVSATPLPNNTPRLRQNKAVRWNPSTGRTSGSRANPRIIAARTRAWRSSTHAVTSASTTTRAMASVCARAKSDNPSSATTVGSSLALKSRSTEANCGSTNMRKNVSTAQAANSTNAG